MASSPITAIDTQPNDIRNLKCSWAGESCGEEWGSSQCVGENKPTHIKHKTTNQ